MARVIIVPAMTMDMAGTAPLFLHHQTPNMIPLTYSQWRRCIVQECRIELSAAFITNRLQALSDPGTAANRAFIRCYGRLHYKRIIAWLQQAQRDLHI